MNTRIPNRDHSAGTARRARTAYTAHASAALPARRSRGSAREPSDERSRAGGFSRVLRGMPLTLALTALVGLLTVTVAAVVAFAGKDPTAQIWPLSMAALAVTSLVGGFIAARRAENRAGFSAVVSGCLFAALLTIPALLLSGGEGQTAAALNPAVLWLIRLGVVLLHGLGALFARPRRKPASHTAGKHITHRR